MSESKGVEVQNSSEDEELYVSACQSVRDGRSIVHVSIERWKNPHHDRAERINAGEVKTIPFGNCEQ
jgi:hypothetical protein